VTFPTPNEEDFNNDWIPPHEALGILNYQSEYSKRRWIMDRLKSGLILAVARTGDINGTVTSFPEVPRQFWNLCDEAGDDHLWETGDITFHRSGATGYGDGWDHRCQDVRFNPASFNGRIPATVCVDSISTLEEPKVGPELQDSRSPIAQAEAERFCRAILAGWPDANQDWAYEKAQLFYPEKKIARDRFRSILRSIRGPVKRGKKAKTPI
jgi:hypothetical protein